MAQNRNNQVAVIEPPRMQMPAHVGSEYNLDQDSWRALTDAVFPSAKTVGAVVLALAYCKKHKLDIFQRPVHIVPIYMNGRTMESVWPGIGYLRIIAQRQGEFAGYDECVFGDDITETFDGVVEKWSDDGRGGRSRSGTEKITKQVTYPEWAQFTVYKIINGERVRMPGPKVYWRETYATMGRNNPCPNDMWEKRPRGQIEKCAEASALRRAFPDVLGNEYAAEEMEGRNIGPAIEGSYVEVEETETRGATSRDTPKAKPKRSDYEKTANTDHPADTRQQLRNEERDKPEAATDHPDGLEELDGDGMPQTTEQWRDFADRIRRRLGRCATEAEIDGVQARQQFRIDAAPPAIQAEVLDEIAQAASNIDPLPDDAEIDDAEQETGGSDEETDR